MENTNSIKSASKIKPRKAPKGKPAVPSSQVLFTARGFLLERGDFIPVIFRCVPAPDWPNTPDFIELTPKHKRDNHALLCAGRTVMIDMCGFNFRCSQLRPKGLLDGKACLRLSPGDFFESMGHALDH